MEKIQTFLKKYTLIKGKEFDLNFFQIAGFPHYEQISSNILKHFLENKFVMKAFFNCISLDFNPINDFIEYVKREVETENGNRIDIVVSTNNYVIGIENKINADLYNPIEDYYSYLNNLANEEGKNFLLIVLSKNKVEMNSRYKNILHKEFSAEVKKYFPELLTSLGHRYFLLFTEYIANIDNLEGVYYMNEEFVRLAKIDDNFEKIVQIMVEGQRLRDDLGTIAYQIINDLRDDNKAFARTRVWKEPDDISGTAVFQDCFLGEEKYNFTIDVVVGFFEFEIVIFERNNRGDKNFKEILEEILSELNTNFDIVSSDGETRAHYMEKIKSEEYDKLLLVLREIINAFNKYVESKK